MCLPQQFCTVFVTHPIYVFSLQEILVCLNKSEHVVTCFFMISKPACLFLIFLRLTKIFLVLHCPQKPTVYVRHVYVSIYKSKNKIPLGPNCTLHETIQAIEGTFSP